MKRRLAVATDPGAPGPRHLWGVTAAYLAGRVSLSAIEIGVPSWIAFQVWGWHGALVVGACMATVLEQRKAVNRLALRHQIRVRLHRSLVELEDAFERE